MICYQTRYEDGVFIGIAQAHEDPMVSGRMVLPGGCTDVAPPAFAAGQQARLSNGAWVTEPISFVVMQSTGVALAISWTGDDMIITSTPAPTITKTQMATWNGATWTVADIPTEEPA